MTSSISHYAVIGNPVKHSRSPWIHQRFAQQTGIALEYTRLEAPLDGFTQSVQNFIAQGGRGLNVTVPFKEQAYDLVGDRLSERALQAQAVNTLIVREDGIHGCNTDGVGLSSDIARAGFELKNKRILIIGAGGAAKGIIGPLLQTGCSAIHIINRTAARAEALCTQFSATAGAQQQLSAGGLPDAGAGWDIVINASASSLQGVPPELPEGCYAPGSLAYDLMYSAQATPFLDQAVKHGAAYSMDGLGMLVGQAAESFWLWHGVRPEVEPVLAELRQAIQLPA